MGLSETIVAAIIGALATLSAALFNWMRARSQRDQRPRRSAFSGVLLLVCLALASAIGGFAYSEMRSERIDEQIRALASAKPLRTSLELSAAPVATSTEALVQLPACVRNTAESEGPAPLCDESSLLRVMLCTQIPAAVERLGVERYSRSPVDGLAWQVHEEGEAPTLGVAFAEAPPPLPVLADFEPVCVTVSNEDPVNARIARLVVRYRQGAANTQPTVASR